MRAITSFGPNGYKVYGKAMLEGWVEHSNIPLIAYVEEDADYPDGVEIRSLWDVPNVSAFLKMTNPAVNYMFDVNRFSRKSFVQIQALREFGEPVFWFDADISINGPFPDLKEFIDGTFIAYMGRGNFYPCTSFVGFNVHPKRQQFADDYEAIYLTGDIYNLPEWHDAFVFNYIRTSGRYPSRDIARDTGAKGSANVFDFIFQNAHHKKGNRKFEE
jgi:hypothetical protein